MPTMTFLRSTDRSCGKTKSIAKTVSILLYCRLYSLNYRALLELFEELVLLFECFDVQIHGLRISSLPQ